MHMLMGFKIKTIMIGETCKKNKQQANRYRYNASRYHVRVTASSQQSHTNPLQYILEMSKQGTGYRVFGVCSVPKRDVKFMPGHN